MWRVKNITAENFMTFAELSFDLENGCTIVKAENRDDEGQESNGGGKTSFIDVFPICVLGQSLTGRALKECVRWGETFFTVFARLEHTDGRVCLISRKVYNNTRTAELHITIDGEVPKGVPCNDDKVDVLPGNKWILEQLLDISKEDLLGYYLISPQYYTSYFKATAKNKVDIINRFSNANKVDEVIKNMKDAATLLENACANNNNDITYLQTNIDALEQQQKVSVPIQDSESILKEYEDAKAKLEELDNHILHLADTSPELDLARSQKKGKEDAKVTIDTQLAEARGMATTMKAQLSGILECPKCNYKFIPDNDGEVETYQGIYDELVILGKQLKDQEGLREGEITVLSSTIQSLRDSIAKSRQVVIEQKESLKTQIVMLKGKAETILQEQEQVKKIKGDIEYNKANLKEKETWLKANTENFRLADKWVGYFEDFKFYLANKPIKVISSYINHYLKENQSEMMVFIEGFKKLKSGKVKQQLNPVVYKNTDEGYSYDTFSGGERVKLNISADLAFQELINGGSESGGLDYYCNDELLNSLDSKGISNAALAFDQIDKTILLVSHSGADLHYDKTIDIIKENGKSQINTHEMHGTSMSMSPA